MVEDIRNRRIEGEVAQPETPAPSTPPPPPTTPPAGTTPPPPVRLEGKYAYQPSAIFRSPLARPNTVTCRYGTKTFDAFVDQAAEAFPGGVRDPGFETSMGTVLHNRDLA